MQASAVETEIVEIEVFEMVGDKKKWKNRPFTLQFPTSKDLLIRLCQDLRNAGFPLCELAAHAANNNRAARRLAKKYNEKKVWHANGNHNTCGVVRWLLRNGARVRPCAALQRGKDHQVLKRPPREDY